MNDRKHKTPEILRAGVVMLQFLPPTGKGFRAESRRALQTQELGAGMPPAHYSRAGANPVNTKAVGDSFMNWDQIEGKWKQTKGSVKEHFGKLTDSDLEQIRGKRDQLIGKIQERYGIAREEAQRQVDEWHRQHEDMHATTHSTR